MSVAIAEPVLSAAIERRSSAARVLFLDRDGITNIDEGYVHTPERTQWVPGIFEVCRAAGKAGFEVVVVTNQAGIARGYYTTEQFREYTLWQHAKFMEEGVRILATYYCPHHPEAGVSPWRVACACRKPQPGMLLQAAADWNIDLEASVLLGDHDTDVTAAYRAGVGTALKCMSGNLLGSLGAVCALGAAARI